MAGYKNRTITLDFADLSEDDDKVYVTIRNPKLVPLDELVVDVPTGPDGRPLDPMAGRMATYGIIAGLVVDWRVYDASRDGDPEKPMGLPATAELVAKLPREVQDRLADTLSSGVDPMVTPSMPTS